MPLCPSGVLLLPRTPHKRKHLHQASEVQSEGRQSHQLLLAQISVVRPIKLKRTRKRRTRDTAPAVPLEQSPQRAGAARDGDVDSSAAPATKRARASKSEITQADLEDLSQSAPSTFVSEDDSDDELARQDVYIELPTLSTSSSANHLPSLQAVQEAFRASRRAQRMTFGPPRALTPSQESLLSRRRLLKWMAMAMALTSSSTCEVPVASLIFDEATDAYVSNRIPCHCSSTKPRAILSNCAKPSRGIIVDE